MKKIVLCLIMLIIIPGIALADSGASDPAAADFMINANPGANASNGSPSVAWDGTNFFNVWNTGTDIYGCRVSPDGVVLDPAGIGISVGLNGSTSSPRTPSVAFDGTNYLVVWVCTRAGATEIYGCRVSPDGTVLDPGGIKITQGGNPKVKPVGITYNGSEYFIVWRTLYDEIRGIRVGIDGTAIGNPNGFQVMSWGFYPTVAYDAADGIYLVATYHNSSYSGYSIHCARVKADGTVLDTTPITLCDAGGNSAYPRVAFDGTNFMVIWTDSRSDASGQCGSLYGARVSPAGTMLGTPFLIANRLSQITFPNTVFDGTDYLVVWTSDTPANWSGEKFRLPDAFAARISTGGTVLDKQPIPLSTSFAHQVGVSIAYGGGRYFASWDDFRHYYNGGTYAIRGRIFEKGIDSLQTPYELQPLPSDITWTSQYAPLEGGATNGVATDSNTAWLFGQNNTVTISGSSWTNVKDFGGEFAGYVIGGSDIWTGGWAGFIKNKSDGVWVDQRPNSGSPLVTGIWGNTNNDVWASLSDIKAFTHYNGKEWSNVPSVCNGDMQDIMGASPDDIWSVGERGAVQHWDGEKWSAINGIPTIQTLNSVWVNGRNDAFAVGDHGVILHYDGISWTAQTSPTDNNLKDVWAVDESHVYAVGSCGTVLRYDGTVWHRENAGTTNDLVTVFGGFGSDGTCKLWAAGYGTSVFTKTISISPPATTAPENLKVASESADTATISWDLPNDRNVTGYVFEYREEGRDDWTSIPLGRTDLYQLTGLDNSKSYAFRLKAQYRYVYLSEPSAVIGGRVLKLRVRYDTWDGRPSTDVYVERNSAMTRPSDPEREGYVFRGWYTATDFKTLWDFSSIISDNIILYANWTPISDIAYVKLDTWDGRPSTDVAVTKNTAMARPVNPSREGYTFGGWYTATDYKTLWDFSTIITENMTLYAKWIPASDTVTVKLDTMNGQPSTDIPVDTNTAMTKPINPSRDGYTFVGWYTNTDYKTQWDFSTPVADNMTLYAKWVLSIYTIKYDANGGYGTTASSTHNYNMAKNLTVNGYARQGFTFKGWSTSRTGTTLYTDGAAVINLTPDDSGTVMLYAVWEKIDEHIIIKPVSISCTAASVTVYGGANGTITVSASGGNSGIYEYSLNVGVWQSGNQFGGLKAGTYSVMIRDAQYQDNTASCTVTVSQPPFVGNVPAKKIPSKETAGNAITVVPPAASKGYTTVSVTYTSTNPAVLFVDANGNATFLAGGKATIITKVISQMVDSKGRVKTKTTTLKKTITVIQPVSSISLNATNATIVKAKKLKLVASIAPVTASNKKVVWKSSNPKVATVSSSGVVTGKSSGTAVITCTAKDGSKASASCIITVMPK